MLATAPTARSVSWRDSRVNTRHPENSQTRARNAAVRAVLADKRLTGGCARFYCLLDQHYGWRNGLVCPKLQTLHLRFGLCRRSMQRWYAQLRECGYLATEPRNGRACRHRLTWVQNVAPEAAPVSPRHLINANESNIKIPSAAFNHSDAAIRPVAVSDRPAVSATHLVANSGENGGQPGQSDAHSPDAGENRAKQGAPAVAVETRSICPHCHGTYYRTIVEWVRAGKQRHRIEKRVLCRCG